MDELFAAITEQHIRSQRAFFQVALTPPTDLPAKRKAHREYREATHTLLELERRHNETGIPTPWDLTIVAQPLVQQTLTEADVADALGDSSDATRLREEALRIAKGNLGPAAYARERRSLASVLALQGKFNEALSLLHDIRREFVELRDVVQEAQTALEEAVVLEWLGDHERTLGAINHARSRVADLLADRSSRDMPLEIGQALVREAKSIFAGAGGTGEAANEVALWRIATELDEHEARARKARGEYDEAARLFEKAYETYKQFGEAGPAIEYQLATIDIARGRFDAARKRLDHIAPAFESGQLRARRAGLRIAQADVELGANGAPQRAFELASDGIKDLREFPDFDLAWRLHWRRARALSALDRPGEALASFSEAARTIDSLRKTPLGYRLDSTYLTSKLPVFEAALDLAEERGDAAACARFIELVKARALSSTLSIPPEKRGAHSDYEAEFDRITVRLDSLEYAGYRGSVSKGARDEHDALLAERRRILEQIRLRDPRWRQMSEAAPFEPQTLLAALDGRRRAALTLYAREDRILAVLVADGEIRVASQPLGAEARGAVAEYSRNLVRASPDVFLNDISVERDLTADALVPRKLLEKALSARALVVAPHRNLHLLPWAGLLFEGKRLFEYTAVGVLPNLSCLTALDGPVAGPPRVALIGAPDYGHLPRLGKLPATGAELLDLETLYAIDDRLIAPPISGAGATEQALRNLAGREDVGGGILHVSCHGSLEIQDPMSAGLLLTDGKLDAAELAMLRLGYEEVVLSACSTGWRPQAVEGVPLTGDDVLGIPGASLEAGARAVLVSIPKANDEATRAFMVRYHTARRGGETPLRAFRRTQLDLLAESVYPPSTWLGITSYATR